MELVSVVNCFWQLSYGAQVPQVFCNSYLWFGFLTLHINIFNLVLKMHSSSNNMLFVVRLPGSQQSQNHFKKYFGLRLLFFVLLLFRFYQIGHKSILQSRICFQTLKEEFSPVYIAPSLNRQAFFFFYFLFWG